MKEMTKSLPVSKRMVYDSYLKVVDKDGGAGIDKQSIDMFNENMPGNLYKIWNRMTSGSYFPPPVRTVFIPKKQGGERPLGIPTVSDRIAQGVVKDYLEPSLELIFHNSSFGYRPKRSAHDALAQCQQNCIRYAWVLDVDIKGFFDNISHIILLELLQKHIQEKWVLMYVERWLKAGVEQKDGSIAARTKGTPQGGVIALRTHSQTLSFQESCRLSGGNFNIIIKSITFMTNGKIAEFGNSQTHKRCVHIIAKGKATATDRRMADGEILRIPDTSVSLYPACKGDQRKDGYTGKFCCLHCEVATYADQANKEAIENQGAVDQQSGSYCAGRIFSKEGSWQKRSNNLRYHLPMIVCGSKSSLRFIISLFRPTPARLLFSLNNHRMN